MIKHVGRERAECEVEGAEGRESQEQMLSRAASPLYLSCRIPTSLFSWPYIFLIMTAIVLNK